MKKQKKYLKILLGTGTVVLLIMFLKPVLLSSWVRNRLDRTFNEESGDYIVSVGRVKASMILSGLELQTIKIESKEEHVGILELSGEIASIRLRGIRLMRAILRKEIKIRKITISEGFFKGTISSPRDTVIPMVLPLKMNIGMLSIERIDLSVINSANAASFSIKDGILRLYDVNVEKHDTLSTDIVNQFDFEAEEMVSVSADSMFVYRNSGISYSASANTLTIDSIFIKPNYTDYDFTSRYEFQKNRIEALVSNINLYDFDISGYIRTGNLYSSFVEIGKLNMKIFRDNRKEFRHTYKSEFQDMIYDYRGNISIDSIALLDGNITYTEHTFEANEPGHLSFTEINARIYKITNDTIFRTDTAYFIFRGDALLMGKGRVAVLLNARIFDSKNTFSLNGTLTAMEANELNPLLEKKAFVYVNSGIINGMKFSFIADSTRAHGTMTMLYERLDLTVKNKRTDDTTAFRERLISWLVNRKVINSNPLPNEEVREGTIDFVRDPERYLIHYCSKALMSGIKSSIIKSQ